MENIVCPHCGKNVELSEAIIHQLSAKVREEESKKIKAQLERQQAEISAKREKELREEYENQAKSREKELLELEKVLEQKEKEAQKREVKIMEAAKKAAQEETNLSLKSLQKQLQDAREAEQKAKIANEELNRKLNQQSQQLQGEVLELDLEDKLKQTFPNDEFLPIPKGIEGGDIWQNVKNNYGKSGGSILWETKRTKSWSKSWLVKLREDTRKINASEAILVSQVVPPEVKSFKWIEGVWVAKYEYALTLAEVIRALILKVAGAKASASHGDEKLQVVYDYIMSDNFRHKFERHHEVIKNMKDELDTEIRLTEIRWRKRKASIDSLDRNTTQMYGDFQGIIPDLPELKGLETPLLADENDNETLF
jgi:hypothetical protein